MRGRKHRSQVPDDDIKYAPGKGARVPPSQRPLGWLERATLAHVAIFLVALSWALGGEAAALELPLAWWGSLGFLLTLTAVQDRDAWRDGWLRPLIWWAPFAAFNALVLVACLNPSLQAVKQGTETFFTHEGANAALPSTARPGLALRALWLFDGVWIACANLALILRQRRAVRLLLLIALGNALVLALAGAAQHFLGARWFFFDDAVSPQSHFFSTFRHHEHWAAYAVLMAATGLALVWHYGRRRETRELIVAPAIAGLVAVAAICATLPLSGSAGCTAIGIALVGTALVHFLLRIAQRRRQSRESPVPTYAGVGLAVALGLAGMWYAVGQNETSGANGNGTTPSSDPWALAREKSWFGWGMASYRDVRALQNPQEPLGRHEATLAESDLALALTEHGAIGTTLLGLCAVVPLLRLRRRHLSSPLPAYLLGGCAAVAAYGLLASPFESPAVLLGWWLCFFAAVHYARLQDREAPSPKAPSTSPAALRPSADCATRA